MAVVGDGEESESRLLVGVSSFEGLGLSPVEEKKMRHQLSKEYSGEGEKTNSTNNYTISPD